VWTGAGLFLVPTFPTPLQRMNSMIMGHGKPVAAWGVC
jgi:hypothetical protein